MERDNASIAVKNSPNKKMSTYGKKNNENSKKKNVKVVNKSCKITKAIKKNCKTASAVNKACRTSKAVSKNGKNASAVNKACRTSKGVSKNCKNAKAMNQNCKNAKAMNKSCKISKTKKLKNPVKCGKLYQPPDETLCINRNEPSESNNVGGSSIEGIDKGRRKQLKPRRTQIKVVSDDTCTTSLVNVPENLSSEKNEEVDEILKKTRGQRKRKKFEVHDFEFLEEKEDIDIDYDLPTDEYRPPEYFEDVHEEFEETLFTKKKKSKNKENSEMKKRRNNIGEIDQIAKSGGDDKARKRGMKRIKVDNESQIDGFVDMPDIAADDFPVKAIVKTKKRKQSTSEDNSCLSEIRDCDKTEDVNEESEEKLFTKKKRVKKSKNEENSEMNKCRNNNGEIDQIAKSGADDKARKRGMKSAKVDNESQIDGLLDMPNIAVDDFPVKATVKTRKTEQSTSEDNSCLSEIRDCDKTEDEDSGEMDEGIELNQDDKLVKSKESRYGQPYSVTGSWYIASGYLQDLTSLLEAFSKENNLRFKTFSSCWQKLKFSLIYRGRQNFKELLEFSEEVALLTNRFLVPPHNLKWRVGALYTIYGLYYKHPYRHFFKIRLIKDVYEQLLNLVDQFQRDIDNPDPAYIFRKMEVEGAFHHVATTSEMCPNLYSMERKAVDMKYEYQRLVNTSPIGAELPSDSRAIDDSLLQQYHRIKTVCVGNGKEPERAVSLVQPSFQSEIDDVIKELKEVTSIQLSLKAPRKTTECNLDKNMLSAIGTRRANIRAKAVAVDTSNEYLKKKGLVSGFYSEGKTCIQRKRSGRPSKKQMERNDDNEISTTDENSTRNLFKRSGSSNDKASCEATECPRLSMGKNVKQFMKPPSAGTLRIPLKSSKNTKVLSNKVTFTMEGEESGVGSENEVDKELNADKPPEQKGLETPSRNEASSFSTDNDYENHLNDEPQVSPPPKRRWGRPRKNVLHKAVEVSKGSTPPKDKVSPVFPSQRGRLSRSLRDMLKTPRFDNEPTVVNTVDAVQVHSNIIDLPKQHEGSSDESTTGNCSPRLCTTDYTSSTNDSNPEHVQDSMNDSICLDAHFSKKGTNSIRKMKFKVKTKVWESIEKDRSKVETLKEKLLQLLPKENLSEVDIITQLSPVTGESINATQSSQNSSPENVNPKHRSLSSLFQCPRKTNTPISVMKRHSESFPSLTARTKGRGITRHGVGKMLMTSIKIGNATHFLPASSHDEGTEQINDELSLPPVRRIVSEVTPIVDNYQIPQSSETSETLRKLSYDNRAESPNNIIHYLPVSSHAKVNDKGTGQIKDELSLPPVRKIVSEVTPVVENYQIPQSSETSETLRKLSYGNRVESPDFISSYESKVNYILSSVQSRENTHDGVDEISYIRRREDTCRTGTSISKQTIDETSDDLWESKGGKERPAKSNAELEVLELHNRNYCHEVLDTNSVQFSENKPYITKNQIYEAHEVRGKARTLNPAKITDPEASGFYEALGSTSIDVINCSEASEVVSAKEGKIHNDGVGIDINDFVNDITSHDYFTLSSDTKGSLSEPASKSISYVSDSSTHVQKDLSLSQASLAKTVTPGTSVQTNYSVVPNEVTSLSFPCTSTVRGDTNVPMYQSRQVQISPPVMENVIIPFSDAPVIAKSPPQQVVAPVAFSTPVSSRYVAEHVSLDYALTSNTSASRVPLCSTPAHQSHHGYIMPLTTIADNAEHQPTQRSMLELVPPRYPEVVTVFPMGCKSCPSMHQPSSTSTPVIFPHNQHSDSLAGLRHLPNVMGSNLLKFKVNNKTVLVPADRVLTSATRVTYATQLANESETLEIRQLQKQDNSPGSQSNYDRNVGIQKPNGDMQSQDTIMDEKVKMVKSKTLSPDRILTSNQQNPLSLFSVRQLEKKCISPGSSQGDYDKSVVIQEPKSDMGSKDTVVDDKKVENVESEILPPGRVLTNNQHNPPSSSLVPVHVESLDCDIKSEHITSFESCSKVNESRRETGSKSSLFRNTKVCSFLFSPKYKALSVMKETLGPATGTPVTQKKSRVPFLLKQSLVPKKN